MEKVSLLSQEFDYSKMIASDAGPRYAASMGWKYDFLDNIALYQNSIKVVDNRITESECLQLEQYISSNPGTILLFKVVDPFEGWCRNHYYYRFLFRIKEFENVFFVTTYTARELAEELDLSTKRKKMVHIPYPFNDTYNISTGLSSRIQKIIFSGNQDRFVYPYRHQFYKKVRFNPCLRRRVDVLAHPGYPDINQEAIHEIIGSQYVSYLSKFRFMFISPSRCGLEFLKYSECAYAGCVPVGKAPISFSSTLKNAFLELDFDNLHCSIKRVFSIPLGELEELTKSYYLACKQERNPKLLNSKLDSFMDGIFV